MPNCSHSSVTVKRELCANITNRTISSIGVTFFQGIMPKSVTHHPGSFVTYLSGSYLYTGNLGRIPATRRRGPRRHVFWYKSPIRAELPRRGQLGPVGQSEHHLRPVNWRPILAGRRPTLQH